MNNNTWGKQLAESYKRKTLGKSRNIRLPAQDRIEFDGEKGCVKVTMKSKAILANLQTNAAAFEAWSLALRVWCDVENIELRWERPDENASKEAMFHYQRFLYRVERFRSLFPEWFHLDSERHGDGKALGKGPFYLNTPGVRRSDGIHGADEPLAHCDAEFKREADLEAYLWKYKPFHERFRLEAVYRQLPVGLFDGPTMTQNNRIFTGGKSAIDLVGIGDGALWLFELKAEKNIPAGILSELIFYTSVMRDAIPGPSGKQGPFQFKSSKPSDELVSAVIGCKRIEAVLLGPQFHPLIGDKRVISTLNEAAARQWNISKEQVPVTFSAVQVVCSTAKGYQFEPGLDSVQ
jgi:hypothetical protein